MRTLRARNTENIIPGIFVFLLGVYLIVVITLMLLAVLSVITNGHIPYVISQTVGGFVIGLWTFDTLRYFLHWVEV